MATHLGWVQAIFLTHGLKRNHYYGNLGTCTELRRFGHSTVIIKSSLMGGRRDFSRLRGDYDIPHVMCKLVTLVLSNFFILSFFTTTYLLVISFSFLKHPLIFLKPSIMCLPACLVIITVLIGEVSFIFPCFDIFASHRHNGNFTMA